MLQDDSAADFCASLHFRVPDMGATVIGQTRLELKKLFNPTTSAKSDNLWMAFDSFCV